MVAMAMMRYLFSRSGYESGLLFGLLWYIVCGVKLYMPERNRLEIREAVLEVIFLKKAEKGTSLKLLFLCNVKALSIIGVE